MRASLGRQLGWYTAGTILATAASVGLFFLYARLLPPEELGVLVIVYAVVTMIRILGTAGAPSGMFRYIAGPTEDRMGRSVPQLVTTTLGFVLVASGLIALVALALAPAVFGSLAGHDPLVLMALAGLTAVASAPREMAEFVLRAEARATAWSAYTVAGSAIVVASAAAAVLLIGATAEAILTVQLLGLALISAAGLALVRGTVQVREFAPGALRLILRIGVPSSVNVLLDWAIRYLDRFILLAFATTADIGVYSFGSRLGLLVQQIGGAAVQAGWDPYSYHRHREPGAPERLGRSSTILLAAVLGQAVLIGAGAAPLVAVVGGRTDYLAGAAFAFPIGLAFWLGTARYILTTPQALRFRPERGLFALAAAAATTLGLDLVLIPAFGIYGAAVATLLGSLVGAIVAFALAERLRSIAFERGRLAIAMGSAIAAYVASGLVDTPSDLADLVLRPLVAGAIYAALLMATGIAPAARMLQEARAILGIPPPRVKSDWTSPFPTLRSRWGVIPIGPSTRLSSAELARRNDGDLVALWKRTRTELTTGEQWEHRGWYHERYQDELRGKRVVDVGCGFAIDSLTFAEHGARVTLMDLHEGNLEVVARIARALGVEVRTSLIEDLSSFDALGEQDAVLALGSLHHAPADLIRAEARALLTHLPVGGRWIQLAYPFSRWEREGRPPFDAWGQMTDGPGTPWAEPYDLPKLLDTLLPVRFEPVLVRELHGGDFIWFDLVRTG